MDGFGYTQLRAVLCVRFQRFKLTPLIGDSTIASGQTPCRLIRLSSRNPITFSPSGSSILPESQRPKRRMIHGQPIPSSPWNLDSDIQLAVI